MRLKTEPFNPCDMFCGMKCIRDNNDGCVFLNSCGAREALLASLIGKQKAMMKRFKKKNGDKSYIPVSELVSLSRVYLMTGFVCWYCGEKMYIGAGNMGSRKNFTADHKIPLSAGGSNGIDNIVFCCYYCNHIQNNIWQKKGFF